MPEVATKVDLCRGHDACPPRDFADNKWSPDVFAETFNVTRQGDAFKMHSCSAVPHPPHSAIVSHGWQTVFVNKQPVAVVTSTVTCPSGIVNTGRPSVLVGEGARIKFG